LRRDLAGMLISRALWRLALAWIFVPSRPIVPIRSTPISAAIGANHRARIERLDHLDHKTRHMPPRQPFAH